MIAVVLVAAAITVVFIRGTIFRRLRESGPEIWRELARCPLCAGVWIGAGWLALSRFVADGRLRPDLSLAVDLVAAGALTGTFALLVSFTIGVLEKYSADG